MRKIFLLLSTGIAMLSACTNTKDDKSAAADSTRSAFLTEFFTHYPHATLQDVYKGEFQDEFGPAHLLTNREAVKSYIVRELSLSDTLGGGYCEPCGWKRRYWRVNLSVIRDSILSVDDFVDAFMASAADTLPTLSQSWINEWNATQRIAKTVMPHPDSYAEDSARIARLHSEGNYVMHHSRDFNKHHHPHYRIMRSDIVEKVVLPAIKAASAQPSE